MTPVTIFTPDQGVSTQYWPQFLPDGRHFLFYQRSSLQSDQQGTYLASLDSPDKRLVLEGGSRSVYVAGQLLFVREGILFAQAFDDFAYRTSGEPVRLSDGVGYWSSAFAYTAVTASSAGVIAHGPNVVMTVMPGEFSMGRNLVLWFIYLLLVNIFAAYVAGRALAPGAETGKILQLVSI